MPGLDFRAGAQVRAGAPSATTAGNAGNPGHTAAELAYGPTFADGADDAHPLWPNDPFGLAFWVSLGSLGALLFIRYTLPR